MSNSVATHGSITVLERRLDELSSEITLMSSEIRDDFGTRLNSVSRELNRRIEALENPLYSPLAVDTPGLEELASILQDAADYRLSQLRSRSQEWINKYNPGVYLRRYEDLRNGIVKHLALSRGWRVIQGIGVDEYRWHILCPKKRLVTTEATQMKAWQEAYNRSLNLADVETLPGTVTE